jgi:ABC-type bacteriocin/lantibiotic exporter with double-glycine peptidase domain
VAANPSTILEHNILSRIYNAFSFEGTTNFLLVVGSTVFLIFLTCNLLKIYLEIFLADFSLKQKQFYSTFFLKEYLKRPIQYFSAKSNSDITLHIIDYVNTALNGVLVSVLRLICDTLIILSLVISLITTKPLMTITIFSIVGGIYVLLNILTRYKQVYWGKVSVESAKARFKILSQIISGIKQIKVTNTNVFFTKLFDSSNHVFLTNARKSSLVQKLPVYFIEIIIIGTALSIVLYLIVSNDNFNEVVPIISLYAVSGRRLASSGNAIYAGFSKIRTSIYAVELFLKDIEQFQTDHKKSQTISDKNQGLFDKNFKELSFNKVSFKYDNSKMFALNEVSLSIKENLFYTILGPSGSGKTTLLDMLLGLVEPCDGDIKYNSKTVDLFHQRNWQNKIGYVQQNPFILDDTIFSNVAFGISHHSIDKDRVKKCCEMAEIQSFIENELQESYNTKLGEKGSLLSGGQKQRIAIARALYSDSSILVLDEATSALDIETEQSFLHTLKRISMNKTIILVTHRPAATKFCDQVIFLKQGLIHGQGPLEKLLTDSPEFSAFFSDDPPIQPS